MTRLEFLLGKQLPYVALAFASFLTLLLMGLFLFRVPVTGSLTALLLGGALYVFASTAFGLVISSFVKSQIAALFATAIVAMTPTVNFSGMLTPVSSLDGASQYMGKLFPSSWFQQVSSGAVTKGLSFADLWQNHLALLAFCIVLLAVARVALRSRRSEMRKRLASFRRTGLNIYRLGIKELRSLRSDPVLVFLIVYAFSWGIYEVATGVKFEVANASVAIIDEDHSPLSREIASALLPPYFKNAVTIDADKAGEALDKGHYTFVLDIPPHFERDLLSGHRPTLQLNVDATAMSMAGNGAATSSPS